MCKRMWSRANERHFTLQHVQDLRKLVDRRFPKQPAYTRNPGIPSNSLRD
jgi:hypothetical protein